MPAFTMSVSDCNSKIIQSQAQSYNLEVKFVTFIHSTWVKFLSGWDWTGGGRGGRQRKTILKTICDFWGILGIWIGDVGIGIDIWN